MQISKSAVGKNEMQNPSRGVHASPKADQGESYAAGYAADALNARRCRLRASVQKKRKYLS